jgi:hypothetical protein
MIPVFTAERVGERSPDSFWDTCLAPKAQFTVSPPQDGFARGEPEGCPLERKRCEDASHSNSKGLSRVLFSAKGARSHGSLGHRPRNPNVRVNQALKARFSSAGPFSIPNIPLVEIDPVLVQQLAILLLKRASAMVLFLPRRTAPRSRAGSG